MISRSTSVLIVDNEQSICGLVAAELAEAGFKSSFVTDPVLARDMLAAGQFKVLIADISMPVVSGLDLLVFVRKGGLGCKVILITGHSSRAYLTQALQWGAYEYVEKPFKSGQIAMAVSHALADDSGRPALGDRAAAAMEMTSKARQASLDSVAALVRAVEAKDPFTRRHSEHVAHYAMNLAQALGIVGADLESIRVAALLHDIGKIGVPDSVLTKAGPLTDEEFQHIRRHPQLGADILASITMFSREAQLLRHHHERWDGKGYPDGLTGEESPLGSRIIQVADCIDAMLMNRTYKRGYSVEKMLGELIRCAATQFDPRIAATAVQWCRDNPDKLILAEAALAASMPPFSSAARNLPAGIIAGANRQTEGQT